MPNSYLPWPTSTDCLAKWKLYDGRGLDPTHSLLPLCRWPPRHDSGYGAFGGFTPRQRYSLAKGVVVDDLDALQPIQDDLQPAVIEVRPTAPRLIENHFKLKRPANTPGAARASRRKK